LAATSTASGVTMMPDVSPPPLDWTVRAAATTVVIPWAPMEPNIDAFIATNPQASLGPPGVVAAHLLPNGPAGSADCPSIGQSAHVSKPLGRDERPNSCASASAAIQDFRQREPGDGNPVSEETSAYLSYDNNYLYAVFVCHTA